MAKNKVSEWSATPADNTDVGGIDINEGCAPSGINNAIRDMMSQIKDMQTGADGDNFTVGGNLSVTGTTTLTGALTGNVTGNLTGNVTGNVTGNITGNITGLVTASDASTVNSITIGYRNIPQNSQVAGYTLALSDNGKHIYYTGSAATITVPTNASVALPVGSAITLINNGSGALTIGTTSLTVYFAGTSNTGNRTLNAKGMATLIKVATDTWFISGVGLA